MIIVGFVNIFLKNKKLSVHVYTILSIFLGIVTSSILNLELEWAYFL